MASLLALVLSILFLPSCATGGAAPRSSGCSAEEQANCVCRKPGALSFAVGGMRCPNCAKELAEVIRAVPGVTEAKVCYEDKMAFVVLDPEHPATMEAIAAAIKRRDEEHRLREPEGCQLTPPASGPLTVAFVIAPDAEVVDFAGPWGVFEYADVPGRNGPPFELFTVAESSAPVRCSGGLTVVPEHTFANSPQPAIIVVPAMGEPSEALLAWLRTASKRASLTMSVCNGSFVLAKAGLLSGKTVTAHHGGYGLLAADFPDVTVRRGARFVDCGPISTAGGLTSGMDLALHVIARYFGDEAAERTVRNLEYQGPGWKDPDSNAAFAAKPVSTDEHPICPVCEMEVVKSEALIVQAGGRTYYFCSAECKERFQKTPERFTAP